MGVGEIVSPYVKCTFRKRVSEQIKQVVFVIQSCEISHASLGIDYNWLLAETL
jgi:hypothetical protein